MNKKVKELLRRNNELDKQIQKENEEAMTNMICYLRAANVSMYHQEIVRQDLLEMILSAQGRGESMESLIGEDYKSFCDHVIESLPPRSKKDRILEFLDTIFISTFSYVGMVVLCFFVFHILECLIKKEAISFKIRIAGGVTIMLIPSIIGAFLIVQFILKTSLSTEHKKERKGFGKWLIYFVAELIILCGMIGIGWLFKDMQFQVNIFAAVAFLVLLYGIHWGIDKIHTDD